MRFSCSDYVSVFKALSDETRLRIVIKLCQKEMCAAALLKDFAITQPTLSYHIRILTDCGLVQARREGNWIFTASIPIGALWCAVSWRTPVWSSEFPLL